MVSTYWLKTFYPIIQALLKFENGLMISFFDTIDSHYMEVVEFEVMQIDLGKSAPGYPGCTLQKSIQIGLCKDYIYSGKFYLPDFMGGFELDGVSFTSETIGEEVIRLINEFIDS